MAESNEAQRIDDEPIDARRLFQTGTNKPAQAVPHGLALLQCTHEDALCLI